MGRASSLTYTFDIAFDIAFDTARTPGWGEVLDDVSIIGWDSRLCLQAIERRCRNTVTDASFVSNRQHLYLRSWKPAIFLHRAVKSDKTAEVGSLSPWVALLVNARKQIETLCAA